MLMASVLTTAHSSVWRVGIEGMVAFDIYFTSRLLSNKSKASVVIKHRRFQKKMYTEQFQMKRKKKNAHRTKLKQTNTIRGESCSVQSERSNWTRRELPFSLPDSKCVGDLSTLHSRESRWADLPICLSSRTKDPTILPFSDMAHSWPNFLCQHRKLWALASSPLLCLPSCLFVISVWRSTPSGTLLTSSPANRIFVDTRSEIFGETECYSGTTIAVRILPK